MDIELGQKLLVGVGFGGNKDTARWDKACRAIGYTLLGSVVAAGGTGTEPYFFIECA